MSFGRHVISTGSDHFVAQEEVTLNEANAGPLVGPIVISEIMYHPPDELVDGELVDLRSRLNSNVDLRIVTTKEDEAGDVIRH